MKKFLFCFLLSTGLILLNDNILLAQIIADSTVSNLPFAIADEKKLSDEDLKNKKEGTYVTGVPDISSDPVNGFGYGAEGSVIFNGKKDDPFFNYTAYRKKLDITLFNTTKAQREIAVVLDIPYIFNTKWRLRMEAAYEVNPNLLYFGATERSLNTLSSLSTLEGIPSPPFAGQKYKDYENSLTGENSDFNNYTKEEYIFNASLERSFWDSKLRILGGLEVAALNITPFDGNSRIRNDSQNGLIKGVGHSNITFLQVGAIYDTRDLETDPSKGIFAEITNEFSNQVLGSSFNFNKTFAQVKIYQRVLPGVFKKFIFAARAGMGYTAGDSPFYEYQDEWSSEGSIEGLGGAHTLRGYKQSRFLARTMNFANIELRCRFAQAKILKQHFAFSAVPFFDIGGVWDDMSRINHLENYRYNEGLGLRIAWNINTILRFDYAISQEDNQFFFNLGHMF